MPIRVFINLRVWPFRPATPFAFTMQPRGIWIPLGVSEDPGCDFYTVNINEIFQILIHAIGPQSYPNLCANSLDGGYGADLIMFMACTSH